MNDDFITQAQRENERDGFGMAMVATEIEVTVDELTDGRYVAWAKFSSGSVEDVVTAREDCRSLHKVFEAVADLYFDSGYLSVSITQKRRAS